MSLLARAGFAFVGLAAPLATIYALTGSVPAIVLAVVAWIAYAYYWLNAGRIWTDVDSARARAAMLGGTILALIAFVVAFFANYFVSIDHELCGDAVSDWIVLGLPVAAYVVGGGLLLRHASRLLWVWPLLVLGMWAVSLVVRAAVPGAHGFCET